MGDREPVRDRVTQEKRRGEEVECQREEEEKRFPVLCMVGRRTCWGVKMKEKREETGRVLCRGVRLTRDGRGEQEEGRKKT